MAGINYNHFEAPSGTHDRRTVHPDEKARALDGVDRRVHGSVEIVIHAAAAPRRGAATGRSTALGRERITHPPKLDRDGYLSLCHTFYRRLWPFDVEKAKAEAPRLLPPFALRPHPSELEVKTELLSCRYNVRERIASPDFPTIPKGPIPHFEPLKRILKGDECAGSLFVGSTQYLFGIDPSHPYARALPAHFSDEEKKAYSFVQKTPMSAANPYRIKHLIGLGTGSDKYPSEGFSGCTVQNMLFIPNGKTASIAKETVQNFLNTLKLGRALTPEDEKFAFSFRIVPYARTPFFTVAPSSLVISKLLSKDVIHQFFEPSFLPLCTALFRKENVLIFDDKGADRSISFVLLFLMYFRGITLNQAFDFVRENKRLAVPSPLLWSVLREFERMFITLKIIH